MTNNIKTLLLLAALTGLIIWIGDMIGGPQGMLMAFGFAILMNGVSYWFSDKIVLMMYGAKPISETEDPELYSMVRNLSMSAGIPMPKIYRMPSEAPNAFATGRNPSKGVIAVTDGLRKLMSKHEVEGVIAHELAHIKNRDILIQTVAAVLAGAIMMLARMAHFAAIFGGGRSDDRRGGGLELLVLLILTPIAAMLIQMAISRSREYQADATGAAIAHSPHGLADALKKLGAYSQRIPMDANPSTAHMFIVNPLSGGSILNLLSTHPPLEKRIEKLRSMHI